MCSSDLVVRCRRERIRMFNLLEDRIWLARREGIAGEDEERDPIRGRGSAGGDHVHRAGADRRQAWDNFPAVELFRVSDRSVRHPLFVMPLQEADPVPALFERLTDADDAAMPEDPEHGVDEFFLFPVERDVLAVQEADERLRHG